jgi:hypothetical protein
MSRTTIHLRRLRLTLPAAMAGTAEHEARRIAEALAQRLHDNGGHASTVQLDRQGQSGAQLADRVAAALPKGGRHGR